METNKPTLRDEALALYVNRPAYIKVGEVAKAINMSGEWLRRFGLGEIENPGVNTVETLIAYIQSRKNKGL